MKITTLSAYIVIVAFGLITTNAADNVAPNIEIDYNTLAKMNRADLTDSLQQLRDVWYDMQDKAIIELRGNGPKQAKLAAIVIAGDYRLDGTAPYLATIIDFYDENAFPKDILGTAAFPWVEYPAAQALWRIGNPSVAYLLANLASSDDKLVRRLSGQTLRNIMGSGPAKVALQEEIQRQTDAKNDAAVARLKAAMPLLDPPQ